MCQLLRAFHTAASCAEVCCLNGWIVNSLTFCCHLSVGQKLLAAILSGQQSVAVVGCRKATLCRKVTQYTQLCGAAMATLLLYCRTVAAAIELCTTGSHTNSVTCVVDIVLLAIRPFNLE